VGRSKQWSLSYIAKEIVDNVIFEGRKSDEDINLLQTAIWSLFREPYVKTTLTSLDFDKIVLREVKSRAENIALAKALRIEPKDAPIVALAHYYAVPLVTMDVKSLLDIKEHIYELIDLDIITVDEFLDML
jgi:predicted nucleic acid-binding protein